jgi:hypothetical protein
MSYNWGPAFIVPSENLKTFSGRVVLREQFDEDLLIKELDSLGFSGVPFKANNLWYYRIKGTRTWVKVGESDNRANWFSVPWDTANIKNGPYEILGLMNVLVKDRERELVILGQSIAEIQVEN